jgi:hypothetical protein
LSSGKGRSDRLPLPVYDYTKMSLTHSPMVELQNLKALLTEAEDLCLKFAVELEYEADLAQWEAERHSRKMAEEDTVRRAGYLKHGARFGALS